MSGNNEKRFSQSLQCGHCLNTIPMEIVASFSRVVAQFEYFVGNFEDVSNVYEVLQCPACSDISFQMYTWCDIMDPSDGESPKLLYPNKNVLDIPLGLPDKIHKAFTAAQKVKSVDANAFAVLIRRVLEMVCIDRNAEGRNLAEQLEDLASKNEIPNKLVKVAKSLKNLGNIGAHASLGELTSEEIPILNALSNAILEYVYTAPHLVNQAELIVKKLKKPKSI